MLLNIYDKKKSTEEPVRLMLDYDNGDVRLNIVDENGEWLHTILYIKSSGEICLPSGEFEKWGFKTDSHDRVKVRKE